MTDRVLLDSKRAAENKLYSFSFTLPVGVTISTKSVAAATYSGTDASPSSLISGAASSSGTVVSQMIAGGTAGVTYELTATVVTSDSQTLKLVGYLVVVA